MLLYSVLIFYDFDFSRGVVKMARMTMTKAMKHYAPTFEEKNLYE